jgi:hypothetical protein
MQPHRRTHETIADLRLQSMSQVFQCARLTMPQLERNIPRTDITIRDPICRLLYPARSSRPLLACVILREAFTTLVSSHQLGNSARKHVQRPAYDTFLQLPNF